MKNSFELYNKAVSIKYKESREKKNSQSCWEFNKEENASLTLQHEVNEWISEYQLDYQWCSILNLYTAWTIISVIFEALCYETQQKKDSKHYIFIV